MQSSPLGTSELRITPYCLGTMTWGSQTDAATAHAQIDAALAAGVNFVDTAEVYPMNSETAEMAGRTEEILGQWIARSGRRAELVLATKVSGPGRAFIRGGGPITPASLREAVEGSLRRLRTDWIDIYQLHWPNRGSYHFRQNWQYDPSSQPRAQTRDEMAAILTVIGELVQEGKIRAFGLSNETAWGLATWARLAETAGAPQPVTMQNEYSLLCRLADTDMAEALHQEGARLLAYSPLGCGLLSGKYAGDVVPEDSRRSILPDLNGRIRPRVWGAVAAYMDIALRHGLDPAHMALAWVRSRPFTGSVIFGARRMDQLEHAIAGFGLELSDAVRAEIDAVHRAHPLPF